MEQIKEITHLKDLHRVTDLIRDGRPRITIVSPRRYDVAARRIQSAVRDRTGVTLPIDSDDPAEGNIPLPGNLVLLGNRSTNRVIGELYNRYYCLLDLKFPGPGGWEVRTLHNPFGNGFNAIFVGASDDAGVDRAADELVAILNEQPAIPGRLSVGWIMKTVLGPGRTPKTDLRELDTWESTVTYGPNGGFGWNSLSKRLALYYTTGDEFHAREFLRLAFPDERAKQEMAEIDGERIENKDDPLAGPYHYSAHLMILFWDLVEESPVFTDEQRLKITQAFSRQVFHAGMYSLPECVYRSTTPTPNVGDRHLQWIVVSFYCLCRYFQKYYPDPTWDRFVTSARMNFASLREHAWVTGEGSSHFWHTTSIYPILAFFLLDGEREPVRNGIFGRLIRAQEILITGNRPDWVLNSAALNMFTMAAYLTQDGRWATYLERLPLETEVFRLGQSFWPEDHLAPAPPVDLVGRWSIHPVPLPEHRHRQSGLPLEQAFYFASFRTAPDETGDFALVAGLNSFGRNYFHVFNLVELRLDGVTLLQGYRNQVHTYADGMMSPQLSRDGAFEYGDCVGQTALVTGFVPRSGFAAWRRNVVQRFGRYVLVIDELQYAGDSENFEARFLWESPFDFMPVSGGRFNLVLTDPANPKKIPGLADYARVPAAPGLRERRYALLFSEPDAGQTVHDTSAAFEYRCAVRQNDNRTFFSLLTRDTEQPLGCRRISDSAAVLDLPEPAVVVRGEFESVRADLAVLAADHLFGHNLACAGPLLWADHPVDLDWDFSTGRLAVVASVPTQLRLRAASGPRTIDVPCGRHTLTDLEPDPLAVKDPIERAHTLQSEPSASVSHLASNAKTSLSPAFEYQAPEPLRLLTVASSEDRPILYAAGEKTVYVLSCEGKLHHTLSTDARIQALHWWPEKNLLLVGCFDDKVLAFDPQGQRRWTFVSEMDPAVFRAAKTYWFKTQPGHEGIHGLFSGKFLDGKSQAFVGSACTLEILDDAGRLVRRLPVFWGPGHQFTLVDAPDGSRNLLVARKPGCAHALAVVNNRRLDADPPHRFNDVPAGHTAVGTGFASTNTLRILVEDLKGHGRNSVVTLINGSWNRVGVFDLEGNPLANAHFGPGEPTTLAPDPGLANKNLRGLEVADVNADGQKEILVATAAGLIVALDPRCQTLWSHRLPEPPAVLQVVRSRIFVGCEGGGVRVLDGQGRPVAFASISGTPIGLAGIDSGSGPLAVFATAAGRLVGFHPDFS